MLYYLRAACRYAGIVSGLLLLVSILRGWSLGIAIGAVLLSATCVILAFKCRCPHCGKPIQIKPIQDDEYCPYCGGKIH